MTAKRFTYCIDEVGMYYYICDNSKRGDDRVIMELDTKFDAIEVCNLLNQLNDENEQLKKELAIYRKVANCSNCKYHNYDWYDDGDEFEVCDKGNDVTDGICKDWEEL